MILFGPLEVAHRFTYENSCRMHYKACLGPPVARNISPFVKHVFLQRSLGAITTVGHSVENYIEWGSHKTNRIDSKERYEGIMIS